MLMIIYNLVAAEYESVYISGRAALAAPMVAGASSVEPQKVKPQDQQVVFDSNENGAGAYQRTEAGSTSTPTPQPDVGA